MSSFRPERRRFLGMLVSLPAAFSFGCATRSAAPTVHPKLPRPEQSLKKLILAAGPWPSGERGKAEDFARRFLAAEGAVSPYLPTHGKLVQALAARVPDGAFAIEKIDLKVLSPEERELLQRLVEQIYSYVEVRFFLSGEPTWGECQPDRIRYTRPPT